MSRKLTLLFSLVIYCHLLCTHLLLLLSMVICFNFLPFSLICSTNMLLFVPLLAVHVHASLSLLLTFSQLKLNVPSWSQFTASVNLLPTWKTSKNKKLLWLNLLLHLVAHFIAI